MSNPFNAATGSQTQIMLPETQYPNTGMAELSDCSAVSDAITFNLGFPKSAIGLRNMPASGTTMPKAAINEHRNLGFTEIEVRLAKNILWCYFPTTDPCPYQSKTQFDFSGLVATSFDRSHVARPFCGNTDEPTSRQFATKDSFHDTRFPMYAKKINSALALASPKDRLNRLNNHS
jgi:hypothetical protein